MDRADGVSPNRDTIPASRFPAAPIAPILDTPTKLAKPSCRERLRCKFWSAPTGALRKSVSSRESVWGLMNAPSRQFAAGNLRRRMMPRAAPFRHGSPSKRSSACSRQFIGHGVAFSAVPYDFAENEYELDPQASSVRGGPPRKLTGTGVVDPPFPPKRPPGPIPTAPSSLLFRILAGLLLAGIAVMTFFLLWLL